MNDNQTKKRIYPPAGIPGHSYLLAALVPLLLSVTSLATPALDHQLRAINPNLSPLAEQNRPLLFERFVAAFDQKYAAHLDKNKGKTLAEGYAVYYLRQELQALIDMWRATAKISYLEQARRRVLKAIADAESNPQTLLWHNKPRGNWPCFYLKTVQNQTGGHNQICDFQGAEGFLMVADALKQAKQENWRQIADFVEKNIVEKWLFYSPATRPENYHGENSNMHLLAALDIARDKREHFAVLCMDLDKLGYSRYPYRQWARLLTDLYIGVRTDLTKQPPNAADLGRNSPTDWGVVPQKATAGYAWYYIPNWKLRDKLAVLDTAHANRTVWFAAKAHYEGLIDHTNTRIAGFVNTLKKQVWKPHKSFFYFANFVDGSDRPYLDPEHGELPPGYKGLLWLGWHRLAAYDDQLKDLFISLAYDLTNGGPNIPLSQNKTMDEAFLCFYAWAVRLLAPQGNPSSFP